MGSVPFPRLVATCCGGGAKSSAVARGYVSFIGGFPESFKSLYSFAIQKIVMII